MPSSHKKRKAKARAKQRELRGEMTAPIQVGDLPDKTVIIRNPPGARKMSEVLDDFIEPYRDSIASDDDHRKLLTLAVPAWNAALQAADEREAMIRSAETSFSHDARAAFRATLAPLIQRKLDHFASNRRHIVSFSLTMEPSGPYLEVMSTLPEGYDPASGWFGGLRRWFGGS